MSEPQHPGTRLRAMLEERGWTQRDLVFVLGCAPKTISQIINGRGGVSPAMSKALGAVFEVPPNFFAEAQMSFDLACADDPDPAMTARALVQKSYPIREMMKRGWIDDDPDNVSAGLSSLFGESGMSAELNLPHAARKTDYAAEIPPAQLAWIFRVRQVAKAITVPRFSAQKLRSAIERMRDLLIEPEEARHAPKMLHDCGVRLVVVETLPGAKIDGVCLWLSDTAPVIGMSLRHDRLDNFWFVIRHEIEHVLRGDGKATAVGMVDAALDGEDAGDAADKPPHEIIADAAAADFCVPEPKRSSFLRRKAPFYYERDLIAFAKVNQIHPGLIVGQIQRATGRWGYLKKYQVPIRPHVLPNAIVDGFGQSVPLI